jgi:methylmalonyl-CoA/ethylmalonyl-CoA epimerase
MLTKPEGSGAGNSILYYKTEDIHAAAAAIGSHGVVFEAEPRMVAKMPDHELWMAFFRDPENNLIALMSEVR